MTLTEVAKRMKVSKQHACNLEREDYGNPSISTVLRYAKAIGAKIVVIDA